MSTSNLPAIIGTALAVLAALALLWSSFASGRQMRDGFDKAREDRNAIRADVREGFAAAATDRNAIRADVAAVSADVRTILERLPERLPATEPTNDEPAEPTNDRTSRTVTGDEPAEPATDEPATDDESSPQSDDVRAHGRPDESRDPDSP